MTFRKIIINNNLLSQHTIQACLFCWFGPCHQEAVVTSARDYVYRRRTSPLLLANHIISAAHQHTENIYGKYCEWDFCFRVSNLPFNSPFQPCLTLQSLREAHFYMIFIVVVESTLSEKKRLVSVTDLINKLWVVFIPTRQKDFVVKLDVLFHN